MRLSRFQEQERRLATERCLKFKGTARIKLDVLDFPLEESTEPDKKNIERLKNLFQGANLCDRLNLLNHIPATIDQHHLTAALVASGVSAESLLAGQPDGYPELDFPAGYRLPCLHGRHRVLAAAEILPRGDRRWAIDLYLGGESSPKHKDQETYFFFRSRR